MTTINESTEVREISSITKIYFNHLKIVDDQLITIVPVDMNIDSSEPSLTRETFKSNVSVEIVESKPSIVHSKLHDSKSKESKICTIFNDINKNLTTKELFTESSKTDSSSVKYANSLEQKQKVGYLTKQR